MGIPMNYGRCEGGPYNAKDMAHPTPTFRVAIDRHSKKATPAVQAGEAYDFGEYRFEGKAWIWQADAK